MAYTLRTLYHSVQLWPNRAKPVVYPDLQRLDVPYTPWTVAVEYSLIILYSFGYTVGLASFDHSR